MASVKNLLTKALCFPLRAQGFSEYMAWDWLKRCFDDLRTASHISIPKKLWAQSKGFLSFRLEQYGINKSNYSDFVSDRDYMWLHPINSHYRKLLDNKFSFRPVLDRFKEHLPKYYMLMRPGARFCRLIDLPDDMQEGIDSVFLLLRQNGLLALKPVRGTHGEGFIRLEFKDSKFYVNLKELPEKEVRELVLSLKSDYIISEYIIEHPQLCRIYPNAVSTLRIITVNQRGSGAKLCEAYLRIGSSSTGVVDNLGAGGMMAELNPENGFYGNAKAVENNRIIACPNHPDTGELIEGVMPHWESIGKTVLEIANYLPQLEYLGFDCAVTTDGFKLIEINAFPDYPRIQCISDTLKSYLFEKIAYKKAHRSEFSASVSDMGGDYASMLSDRVSARFMLDFLPNEYLCKCFYHVVKTEGEIRSYCMPDPLVGEELCARPVKPGAEDMVEKTRAQELVEKYGEVLICEMLKGERFCVVCEKGAILDYEKITDPTAKKCAETVLSAFANIERLELHFIASEKGTKLIDCFVPISEG